MIIRKIEEKDLENLLNLSKSVFKDESWNEKQFADAIKQNFCIGVFAENELVCFLLAENLIDDFNILLIGTRDDFKNKGLASSLLKELENECKKEGLNKIWLEVKDSNLIAKNFYFKHNFKELYIRKKYYSNGDDACILEKNI